MRLFQKLLDLEKKFAWGVLGAVLSIVGLWVARTNPQSLLVEVVSEERVYDVHADVPDLKILFRGEEIHKQRLALSLFSIRFENSGGKPLTPSSFDPKLQFGLRAKDGTLFPPEITKSSQAYIQNNLKPALREDNSISLEKLVLDPGAHFTIRVLSLHPLEKRTSFYLLGKIAEIEFGDEPVPERLDDSQLSTWHQVIQGRLLIHFLRAIAYIFSCAAFALTIALTTFGITRTWTRWGSRAMAKRLVRLHPKFGWKEAKRLSVYAADHGDWGLYFLQVMNGRQISPAKFAVEEFTSRNLRFSYCENAYVDAVRLGILSEQAGIILLAEKFLPAIEDLREIRTNDFNRKISSKEVVEKRVADWVKVRSQTIRSIVTVSDDPFESEHPELRDQL